MVNPIPRLFIEERDNPQEDCKDISLISSTRMTKGMRRKLMFCDSLLMLPGPNDKNTRRAMWMLLQLHFLMVLVLAIEMVE